MTIRMTYKFKEKKQEKNTQKLLSVVRPSGIHLPLWEAEAEKS